ncbi:MAG: type I-C CRISPR-associated protein Cas8c/Csd1, partial [Firmicutes bacterium]|nr:type I-C CRISPR-associated protein Cas8c/Csd1 [Bacillota bacterium]
MILSSLVRYYNLLIERGDSEVPAIGYSAKEVAYALNLSKDGQLLEVIALGDGSSRRRSGISLIVPEEVKRTVNAAANFMCDNCKFTLGIDKTGVSERSQKALAASKELHRKVLGGVDDEGARAVLSFFDSWDPGQADSHPALKPVRDSIV